MAERRIVEQTGKGIVCFISNYSWLDGLSFTAMHERYLEVVDRIWIDSLNGDKYKTGKLTPEGEPDPSVFSTEWNREGIQVGTAIALLIRENEHAGSDVIRFRNLWGREKRAELLASAEQDGEALYQPVKPPNDLGLPFMPVRSTEDYLSWALLPDLFPASYPGVKTSRDDFVVDIDRDRLIERMEQYFDPEVSHAEMRRIALGAMERTARFNAEEVRYALRHRGFLPDKIVRCCYRPFDVRWLYWEPETKLLDEKREDLFAASRSGMSFLISCPKAERQREGTPFYVAVALPDWHLTRPGSACLPMGSDAYHAPQRAMFDGLAPDGSVRADGGSSIAHAYVSSIGAGGAEPADLISMHALAVGYSPSY